MHILVAYLTFFSFLSNLVSCRSEYVDCNTLFTSSSHVIKGSCYKSKGMVIWSGNIIGIFKKSEEIPKTLQLFTLTENFTNIKEFWAIITWDTHEGTTQAQPIEITRGGQTLSFFGDITRVGLFTINIDTVIPTFDFDSIYSNSNSSSCNCSFKHGDYKTTEVGGSQSFNIMQPFLAVNYVIALTGLFPSRRREAISKIDAYEGITRRATEGSEPFLGEIMMVAFNFAPRGWAMCDGQLLPISQNSALFSLLGTIYGGDGRTTFALPDLRGRVPIHSGTGPGLSPRVVGSKSGEETALIQLVNMAQHSHDLKKTP